MLSTIRSKNVLHGPLYSAHRTLATSYRRVLTPRTCTSSRKAAGPAASRRSSAPTAVVDAPPVLRPPPAPVQLPPQIVQPEPCDNSHVDEQYRHFLAGWDKGFTFNHDELPEGCWLEVTEGELPQELQGTFFRNGPGRFTQGDQLYGHPYDGDGLVASVAFSQGRAFFRSAFVRTIEYQLEAAAQQVLFRGSFATQLPGGPLANALNLIIKNNTNTSCLAWGDKLLTFFEAALPYRLDPASLETLGQETLTGRLRPGVPTDLGSPQANAMFGRFQSLLGNNGQLPPEQLSGGGDAFTAHPHVDANTGRLCFFTYKTQARGGPLSTEMDTKLRFWEVAPGGWSVVETKEYTMPGYGFLHDFGFTANYFVLIQGPISMDIAPYLVGNACAASCVRWKQGAPTLIHVVPRPGSQAERRGEQVRVLELSPPTFVFHHCNAFEQQLEDGSVQLVVDAIHYDSLPAVGKAALDDQQVDPNAGFRARLRRLLLDLGSLRTELLPPACPFTVELPDVNPSVRGRRHRYVYSYASDWESASLCVAKVDMDTGTTERWHPGPGYYCLEPVFVPSRSQEAEDDGYVLTFGFDSRGLRSEVLVLDARRLAAGPLARLALPRPLPHGLHGCWSEASCAPTE